MRHLKSYWKLIALLGTLPVMFGGCIVDGGSDAANSQFIKLTNDNNLRAIKANDRFVYEFGGTYGLESGGIHQNTSGTLTIEYSSTPTITDPFLGTLRTVLKETSTLEFNNGPTLISIRYISQDANGQISVVAYPGSGTGNEYWVNDSQEIAATEVKSNVNASVLLQSPIIPNANYKNYLNILYGCNSTLVCEDWLRKVTETVSVAGDITTANTPIGNFETYQLNFNGSSLDLTESVSNATNALFDIRSACEIYNQNSSGKVNSSFYGNLKIHPAVGIIRWEINCTSIGYSLVGFLTDTRNIDIPEATTTP